MPEPTPAPGFVYRLPPDVAARIQGKAPCDIPLVVSGSPLRRLVVLVLVLGLLGTGLATGLAGGPALRGADCRPGSVVDVPGAVSRDENRLC